VPPRLKVRARVPSATFQNLMPVVAICWLSGKQRRTATTAAAALRNRTDQVSVVRPPQIVLPVVRAGSELLVVRRKRCVNARTRNGWLARLSRDFPARRPNERKQR
jgi:hypothetical protein